MNPVTQTLYEQIGRRTFMMIGAKDLIDVGNGLAFRIGRNAKSVNRLRITLQPSDTYKVEAIRVRGSKVTIVAEHDDVYVESLHQVIEAVTGMFTRL